MLPKDRATLRNVVVAVIGGSALALAIGLSCLGRGQTALEEPPSVRSSAGGIPEQTSETTITSGELDLERGAAASGIDGVSPNGDAPASVPAIPTSPATSPPKAPAPAPAAAPPVVLAPTQSVVVQTPTATVSTTQALVESPPAPAATEAAPAPTTEPAPPQTALDAGPLSNEPPDGGYPPPAILVPVPFPMPFPVPVVPAQ